MPLLNVYFQSPHYKTSSWLEDGEDNDDSVEDDGEGEEEDDSMSQSPILVESPTFREDWDAEKQRFDGISELW